MEEFELQEIESRALKASPTEEWAKDRTELIWHPSNRKGVDAVILYDDHDFCAEIYDNAGLGCWADNYANFFSHARKDILKLINEI